MIWTRGGTSHHDTFDPKPNAPASVRGEFGVIDTAIPGVQFTEIVPNMAKNLDRFAVLRGWNPKNGSHGMADQYVLSGQKFNAAVHLPDLRFDHQPRKGIQIGITALRSIRGHKSITDSAVACREFWDSNTVPLRLMPTLTQAVSRYVIFHSPKESTGDRVSRRQKMLARIDDLQRSVDLQPVKYNALDEHYKAALNMITAKETKQAFQVEEEDPKLRDPIRSAQVWAKLFTGSSYDRIGRPALSR